MNRHVMVQSEYKLKRLWHRLAALLIVTLERFRTEIAQRRVTAFAVVPDFDPGEDRRFEPVLGWRSWVRYTISFLRLAKKLSVGALSQQLPRRLMLHTIPASLSCFW